MKWASGLAWGLCVLTGCDGGANAPAEQDVYAVPPLVLADSAEPEPLEEELRVMVQVGEGEPRALEANLGLSCRFEGPSQLIVFGSMVQADSMESIRLQMRVDEAEALEMDSPMVFPVTAVFQGPDAEEGETFIAFDSDRPDNPTGLDLVGSGQVELIGLDPCEGTFAVVLQNEDGESVTLSEGAFLLELE